MIRKASSISTTADSDYEAQGYRAALAMDTRKPIVQAIREEMAGLIDGTVSANTSSMIASWGIGFARGIRERANR